MIRQRSILIAVLIISLAALGVTQWEAWQTERAGLAPLLLEIGGPKVEPMGRMWIDTDGACGASPQTDPDDCFAILWLASRKASVVGISTSFGNASGKIVPQRVAVSGGSYSG